MENLSHYHDTFVVRRLNISIAQHYNLFAEYIKILQELKDKYADSKHNKLKIIPLVCL